MVIGNVDDDDWEPGHTVPYDQDGHTASLDGPGDESDLGVVVVRSCDFPDDWRARLALEGDPSISVYELAGGTPVLGHHAGGVQTVEIPREALLSGDLAYAVEPPQLLHAAVDPVATVRLRIEDAAGTPRCTDEVDLRLSSWFMPSNLDHASTVYVRQLPPDYPLAAESAQFVADLQVAVAGTGATVAVVTGAHYGYDVWMQDQIEIGYTAGPNGHSVPVVLNSPRDRGLADFAERELFRADVGYFRTGSDAETQDSFGNLEVTPPLTADGSDYPFGRIYNWHGHAGGVARRLPAQPDRPGSLCVEYRLASGGTRG